MPKGKSSSARTRKNRAPLPVLVDPRFAKALDHVLRQHILLAAVQGEISPKGLSQSLGEPLGKVSYHVKVLHEDCDELIEETRRVPRRGAVEHYYRASARTLLPAKAWRRAKKGIRAVVGAGQASDLFNDLAEALKAGKLQGVNDHITRTPLVLDFEGRRNVKAIAARATREVEAEQRAAVKRMEKANGDGGKAIGCTFALLAFEAAWEPADRHALAARVKGVAAPGTDGGGRKRSGRRAAAGK